VPIPAWTKPGLGGLGVGLLALKLPQVLGGGYGWIQLAVQGQLALKLLLVLVGAKLLALPSRSHLADPAASLRRRCLWVQCWAEHAPQCFISPPPFS
jgi:hypothetical protein